MPLRDGSTEQEEVVALQAEELAISRRITPGVTFQVRTVTHERQLPVDERVFRESVEVSRVPVNREVSVAPAVTEEGDLIIVPVLEEELVITRRLILKEEIHLRRVRTFVQHQETVTLREQEAVVTREASAGSSQPENQENSIGES